ncbi:MAG TPA: TIGR02530 family flagellar biosynthesis protein [Chitinispirillaceae bacterium]|nr:TIGR02530 family flagellar biosynthesis protein [Chitinispirillaceae bacterium]
MNTVSDSTNADLKQRITAHRSAVVSQSSIIQSKQVSAGHNRNGIADFSEQLRSKIEGVKFSAHAATRLKSRNIEMTDEIIGKLEKAVSGAAGKGARDSLILMKDLAFIVNIPNRTVITAMDGESIKQNIFTNIDSAVIAD